ncbi:hypothetical protein F0562_006441 [Nyssa sinensis]|uniref:Uncharacterized protein n=1 Tax=Nyssa sinensis TaxID=561372 RepID=A0A5J5AQ07_9ASTE|nr:hypothetical protein F0562_006441 [Nyssa sinensis]
MCGIFSTHSICYKGRSEFNISPVLHVHLYNEICAMISAITSGQLADFIGHKGEELVEEEDAQRQPIWIWSSFNPVMQDFRTGQFTYITQCT